MRILIVDDDEISCARMVAILSEHGRCETADCGELAVGMFADAIDSNEPYGLITMDVEMPGMSGQDAIEAIRIVETEHGIDPWDGVRVIMVTCHKDSDNVLESFRAGCRAYVVKPATREAVKDKLEKFGLLATSEN